MGTDASDSPLPSARSSPAAHGDAPRHLMLFSYWFPPANAVGSSRPLAMARHFAARGWRVTVMAGAAQAVPPSFAADLAGFDVHYVPDTWLRSEEHTSELQSLMRISYAVFCLKKKKNKIIKKYTAQR